MFGDSQKRKAQSLKDYMKADGAAHIKGATSMDVPKKAEKAGEAQNVRTEKSST